VQHELCKISEVPSTGTKIVPFFGREVHVYKTGNSVRAVANVCMHFGGPLDCKDGKFVCPWHAATYDLATGNRIDGPAPKGIEVDVSFNQGRGWGALLCVGSLTLADLKLFSHHLCPYVQRAVI
jgi:nitrite reductase/ring-hydroxylating ferredoxin subunit